MITGKCFRSPLKRELVFHVNFEVFWSHSILHFLLSSFSLVLPLSSVATQPKSYCDWMLILPLYAPPFSEKRWIFNAKPLNAKSNSFLFQYYSIQWYGLGRRCSTSCEYLSLDEGSIIVYEGLKCGVKVTPWVSTSITSGRSSAPRPVSLPARNPLGFLPERRKNPERITKESALNWAWKVIGDQSDVNDIYLVE
jgi:hypothetical protein